MQLKVQIKICGIKTIEEVRLINYYKISYAGFIFAPSKRQVTIKKAQALIKELRSDIKAVGVFVDADYDEIMEAIKECSLDVIQLHGDEQDGLIKRLPIEVFKSISIKGIESIKKISDYPSCDGLLLDTYYKGAIGGTGHTFNWDMVKNLKLDKKIILAGGLSPENIVEAIKTVRPFMVDLNSGLETNLLKGQVKIEALFNQLNRNNIEVISKEPE